MTKELYNWLFKCFMRDNHTRYHHYFKEWVDNLTDNQISGFEHQRFIDENNILQ